MHMFAVLGHQDQLYFTLPPPAPAPLVKKNFPLQLPVRNRRSVMPKEMLMKLLQNYIKLITLVKMVKKHAILSVSTAKKLKKLV